ncbi:hypothetical protein [Methanoculleus chikugoensis]|uniref:hypothetical protein n=1 Tax=Methanoculleus chikugoensis TaxID=118126 RepID=UPI001FB2B50D|nr:hypothetical protein [Methanoculleus chikugoensis]
MAGILVVILFVFIALTAITLAQSSAESFRSTYHYGLTLSTSGPLDNAVLLIPPLPSYYNSDTGTNVTPVNLSRASFSNLDRSDVSVKIENVGGGVPPMLNISAGRLNPVYKNRIRPIGIMPGQNESELPPEPTHVYSDRYSEETQVLVEMEVSMPPTESGHEIETRTPIGGVEPLLVPPYRIVGNLSNSGGLIDDYYVSPGSSGYVVEVPFILSFDAADENVLTISADLLGGQTSGGSSAGSRTRTARVCAMSSGGVRATARIR